MSKCAIILAAGQGTRMKSSLPKVLHKVCGKEMINHVSDALRNSDITDINIVIGNGAEQVKFATNNEDVKHYLQEVQLGTGHAVICAKECLANKRGTVVILAGDGPLVSEEMLSKLFAFHESGDYKATVVTSILDNPERYGRIIRNNEGNIEKIVEFKDCSEEEKNVQEINSAIYCFDIESLRENIDKLENNNAQKEYYLTDMIEILKKNGHNIGGFVVDKENIMAVNSRSELAEVEKIMRKRINNLHLDNGVTLIDPDNTYIEKDVVIENDVVIYPGCLLQGKTLIKSNSILYPNCRIVNSTLEENVVVQNSVILDSIVGENTTVGPYAYIRPDSVIGKNVKVGDFVEIKKSVIGDKTKISHLTYIGDADVGKNCNFGCGTVVVNYDGTKKHKTIIGDNAFVGCNTNLVSPVEVEDNTYIAAGSTITDKVPEGSLAIARARQVNKEGWVYKNKK